MHDQPPPKMNAFRATGPTWSAGRTSSWGCCGQLRLRVGAGKQANIQNSEPNPMQVGSRTDDDDNRQLARRSARPCPALQHFCPTASHPERTTATVNVSAAQQARAVRNNKVKAFVETDRHTGFSQDRASGTGALASGPGWAAPCPRSSG